MDIAVRESAAFRESVAFDYLSFAGPIDGLDDSISIRFRFPNNYGASIIRHDYSYGGRNGLFELAVIRFNDDGSWEIDSTTPVTGDVLGWLSVHEIDEILLSIIDLPECDTHHTLTA